MATYRITTKRKALKGTALDDSFFGSKFKDVFDGRAGNDYIYGADGSDNLSGGDGNDALYTGSGSDKALGGKGNDYLTGGLGNDRLYGGEGKDSLLGEEGNDSLYGDAGRDNLTGSDGNDKLYGGEDDDSLSGNEGNDRLDGGKNDDYLTGQEGSDKLYGGEGDDSLYGGEDNDRLDGGKGDDQLYGGAGSDYLSGGAGDDVLDGSEPFSFPDPSLPPVLSTDRLLGGDGNDRIIVDERDYALGGKGVDTLSLEIYGGSASSDYTVFSLDFSKATGKKAADIGYQGIKAGQFEKVSLNIYNMDAGSVITGSKGNDSIYGDGKAGVINGGSGDDSLWAYGDDPDNGIIVNGGKGDDILRGSGNVTLVGGAGDDQFTLSHSPKCTIADFSGKDYFLLRASSYQYYDGGLDKYIPPTFDLNNLLVVGTDPKPATTLAQFFYDTDDGKLYFDADGTGSRFDLDLMATLANKAALKASDFVIIM